MRGRYTETRIPEFRANLRKAWANVTSADVSEGERWYADANRIMRDWAEHYGLPIETVASVTAALSPQCRWDLNLIGAANVLDGEPLSLTHGPFPANYRKAVAILEDKATSILPYFVSAPKVASFQQNLQGNLDFVTVDTHAAQAALGDATAVISLKWKPYVVFAAAYAANANEMGLAPAVYQAILWVSWKRMYPPGDKRAQKRRNKRR